METKRSNVVASVMLAESEVGATVVLSSVGGATAVASTLGSGGAGVVVMAGSSVRVMECGLAEDDPRPATFELPVQVAVGDGSVRYFAGAALCHTGLQVIFLGIPIVVRRLTSAAWRKKHKALSYLSMLFCGAHAFFTPAILGACSTVLINGSDSISIIVAATSATVILSIHLVVTVAIHLGPKNGIVSRVAPALHGQKVKFEFDVISDGNSTDDSEHNRANGAKETSFLLSGSATKDILLTLFDGCRYYEKTIHRHYASIETTLCSVVSIISGARLSSACSYAAFSIGCVAMLHLVYVVVVRPFRTRLDTAFSLINGLLLVGLSASVAVVVRMNRNGVDGAPELAQKTIEVSLWLMSVMGFVQLAVQGYWAYHIARRRHKKEKSSGSSEGDDVGEHASNGRRGKAAFEMSLLSEPLLVLCDDDDETAPRCNARQAKKQLYVSEEMESEEEEEEENEMEEDDGWSSDSTDDHTVKNPLVC